VVIRGARQGHDLVGVVPLLGRAHGKVAIRADGQVGHHRPPAAGQAWPAWRPARMAHLVREEADGSELLSHCQENGRLECRLSLRSSSAIYGSSGTLSP